MMRTDIPGEGAELRAGGILPSAPVTCDARSLIINGRRELLIAGEMHYARIPRAEWSGILDTAKASGLNCIATYVFWNVHEAAPGHYDFSGENDLAHFLQLCQEKGLFVFLRAGPYCCAEWNYGGFPAWLRDEPGIVFRTLNPAYLRRTEKYLRHLFAEVLPYLFTAGGPIILVQLENEYANIANRYKDEGQRYLAWIMGLGARCGIDVPVVMCEGGAPGSLEALNGFLLGPDRVEEFIRRHPKQPLLWTELWTGWYDTWCYEQHVRDPRNIAYHLLRYLAGGGTAWNYYMWHGGSNFGRTSMYLQTQSYGFRAPLDEWGRITRQGRYLAALHDVLIARKDILLDGARGERDGGAGWKSEKGGLRLEWDDSKLRAVLSDERGRILFDTEAAWNDTPDHPGSVFRWRPLVACDQWAWAPEPFPAERAGDAKRYPRPVDQLICTRDETDYCWYSHVISPARGGIHALHLSRCGDFVRVYVNGRPAATSRLPLKECRGQTLDASGLSGGEVNPLEEIEPSYALDAEIVLDPGENRIDILCGAMGMIKGDWMVSGPMTNERKGIWGDVLLDGRVLEGWELRPGLRRQPGEGGFGKPGGRSFLGWWQAEIELDAGILNSRHDFRLDLAGWDKGMIWVNGRLLGRYWLTEGYGHGVDEPWHRREANGLVLEGRGTPTQRFYRVPNSWLGKSNAVTLFEEGEPAAGPKLVLECRAGPRFEAVSQEISAGGNAENS